MEEKQTKQCKYCQTEIPRKAKICPNCKKKQGPKIWLIVLIVIVLLGIISSLSSGGEKKATSAENDNTAKQEAATAETKKEEAPAIEYTAYDVDELMTDLNSNALKAESKYKDQYVEITGKLSTIDSSGKYISLNSLNADFEIMGVQCSIKDDDQKAKVMEMSTGDTVTLKGKVKDVGEVMGYALDITEIE